MAVSAYWYEKAFANMLGGETAGESSKVDWLSDAIKVMLCTSAYTPDQGLHEFQSDVTGEVANGNGYTTGGAVLANKTLSVNTSTKVTKLSGDAVSWSNSTITARYAVIYDSTPGSAASNPLLGYVDFGADFSSNNGTFQVTWDAAGIFTITVA